MRIAAVQFRSALLDREESIRRVVSRIHEAADRDADLVVFPEACVPGYPAWLSPTGGARFDDPRQKAIHARYVDQSIAPVHGHLEAICATAAVRGVEVVLGAVERGIDRGGHTLYCTAFWIDRDGHLANVHRKLVPTYEERLCWGPGDGHGLRTREVAGLRVGALNCWENWMPLARAALQADGLDVHLMLWPGAPANTRELTRVAAREGRCYVIGACGVLHADDLPSDLPELADLRESRDGTEDRSSSRPVVRAWPDPMASGSSIPRPCRQARSTCWWSTSTPRRSDENDRISIRPDTTPGRTCST